MPRIVSLAKLPAAFLTGLTEPWRRQVAIVDLQRLSNHILADIGIERGRIPELVDAMMACDKAEPTRGRTVFAPKPVQPTPASAPATKAA